MNSPGRPPIPISRDLDTGALCRDNPCDILRVLGSFWTFSTRSFDSRVVKAFKECLPAADYAPHIHQLCEFYADRIIAASGEEKFGHVARVLGSSETTPDPCRPQTLLAAAVLKRSGAIDAQRLFFKSGPRPPMRMVRHLSGPEAMRTRISYAAQDLFVRPEQVGGTVLLIDDIINTGASVRLYAGALKRYCGVERVVCVNLAVTRFGKGSDGWGTLRLDTSPLQGSLGAVWVDSDGVFHDSHECGGLESAVEMRFIAEKRARPCRVCISNESVRRRWWQLWKRDLE